MEPLPISALLATGAAALALQIKLIQLLQAQDSRCLRWQGLGGLGWIVVLGEDLPWVNGLIYLGKDPQAPQLLFPTHLQPHIHPVLLARAFQAQGLLALIPDEIPGGPALIPLGNARPLALGPLQAWRAQ
jgi:hypothetical protein